SVRRMKVGPCGTPVIARYTAVNFTHKLDALGFKLAASFVDIGDQKAGDRMRKVTMLGIRRLEDLKCVAVWQSEHYCILLLHVDIQTKHIGDKIPHALVLGCP